MGPAGLLASFLGPEMTQKKLPISEFVIMLAMLFALVAFSTDAMLPAFPSMAAELTPDNPNSIALVISAFIFGLGIGLSLIHI